MKGLVVVLHREAREFWPLLPASLIAGIVCALWPAFREASDPSQERLITSTMLGVGGAFGVAAVLGAIALGRDLYEGRLGFYFTRPLSAFAIWAGKLGAVPVLATSVALLAWLPSCFDPVVLDEQARQIRHSPMLLFVFVGTLGIAAVSHVVGVWFRSRSHWLLLDLPALTVSVLLAWRLIEPGAAADAVGTQRAVGILVMSAASLAGLAQIVVGRTDIDRGRRVLSLVMSVVLLGGMTVLSRVYGP